MESLPSTRKDEERRCAVVDSSVDRVEEDVNVVDMRVYRVGDGAHVLARCVRDVEDDFCESVIVGSSWVGTGEHDVEDDEEQKQVDV